MKSVGTVASILVLVGALNWGLVGLMNLNLVTAVFGEASSLTTAVYALVGLSALYMAYNKYVAGK